MRSLWVLLTVASAAAAAAAAANLRVRASAWVFFNSENMPSCFPQRVRASVSSHLHLRLSGGCWRCLLVDLKDISLMASVDVIPRTYLPDHFVPLLRRNIHFYLVPIFPLPS